MRTRQFLDDAISGYIKLETGLEENIELIALGEAEGDTDVVAEAEQAIADIRAQAAKNELEALLSGEADGNDCYVEIHAGAGGTESQDWAQDRKSVV